MHADLLRSCLESFDPARPILYRWGLRDPERGWRNLSLLAERLSLDGLREVCTPLGRLLPRCPDPDRALNNLETRPWSDMRDGKSIDAKTLAKMLSTFDVEGPKNVRLATEIGGVLSPRCGSCSLSTQPHLNVSNPTTPTEEELL